MKYTMRSLHAEKTRGNAPADAARRAREHAAGVKAYDEMIERFAPITLENFDAAKRWLEARRTELLAEGGAQ